MNVIDDVVMVSKFFSKAASFFSLLNPRVVQLGWDRAGMTGSI